VEIKLLNAGIAHRENAKGKSITYDCKVEAVDKDRLDGALRFIHNEKNSIMPMFRKRSLLNVAKGADVKIEIDDYSKSDSSYQVISNDSSLETMAIHLLGPKYETHYAPKKLSFTRITMFIHDNGEDAVWLISDDSVKQGGKTSADPAQDAPSVALIYSVTPPNTLKSESTWCFGELPKGIDEENPFLSHLSSKPLRAEEMLKKTNLILATVRASMTPPSVCSIPSQMSKIREAYPEVTKTGAKSRTQLLYNALLPFKDEEFIKELIGDYVVASVVKDTKTPWGQGVPMNRASVEKSILHMQIIGSSETKDHTTFVARMVEDEDTSLMNAVIDHLPMTVFTVSGQAMTEIEEDK